MKINEIYVLIRYDMDNVTGLSSDCCSLHTTLESAQDTMNELEKNTKKYESALSFDFSLDFSWPKWKVVPITSKELGSRL